ncbi:MAG: DUF3419 family protein [Methylotenera sp.]|nr:DUF3419 family protein [Oligoflexia bacterium]
MSNPGEYFTGINYSLANEDTWVEYRLAPQNAKAIVAVAGSGSRVLPLLARSPRLLEIVDLSEAQLYLAELRMEAVRELSHEEFLHFLGYRGAIFDGDLLDNSRAKLFKRLKLSEKCFGYWNENREWEKRGVIYLGKWENHFIKLGKLLSKIIRLNAAPLFEAHSIKEQNLLLKKHWNETRFRNFLRVALSEFVFQKFLYGKQFAGSKEKRTAKEPTWKMVDREMNRLFKTTLLRKNYFIQMIYLGAIRFEEGLPAEAHPEIFAAAKAALRSGKTEITYLQKDFVELTREKPYDFYSLSDAISYVADEPAKQFLSRLPDTVALGSTMVIRSFMRQPSIHPNQAWKIDKAAAKAAHAQDCTGMYEFVILTKS